MRVGLDLLLGRPFDREAATTALQRDLNEWLPTVAERFDTAAIRAVAMRTLDLDALVREGRAKEAFEAPTSALEDTPGAPSWFRDQRYGWLVMEAGAFEEAVASLKGTSRSRDRTLIEFALGRTYEGMGRAEEALDAYRTFLMRTAPADEQLGAVIYAREALVRLGG